MKALCLPVFFLSAFAVAPALSAQVLHPLYGPFFSAPYLQVPAPQPPIEQDVVRRWNRIAIDASGLDHTPVPAGDPRVFGEQIGPGRSSRAMAIVHIAMADVLAATRGGFRSYTGEGNHAKKISVDVAIMQAAHDSLAALFPSQAAAFDRQLQEQILATRGGELEKANGRELGARIAARILAMRTGDGSATAEPALGPGGHVTSPLAGHWRQDPISQIPVALGAYWGACVPFVLATGSQFRLPPPPAMDSAEYTAAYNEVKSLGGDGIVTPTVRTPEQTFIGIYWAYDGTPSLCAPPRLYNQIAVQIADQRNLDATQLARLLALVNVAMADTGMAAWDSKYHWDLWRPITGIRESDPGTGPTGSGDGNPNTIGDTTFMPLGAPASNLMGPNFTPPFPAYPSGHAAFGGALFQVMRRFFGTDDIQFTFVSDEYNGMTRANDGTVRPYVPRTFANLSQAEEENGQSRIYLGIHWSFDKTSGITQGRQVADYIFDRIYGTSTADAATR
jgi:hypothetical protein